MLECTVACSMYLAIPVTKAFLSSKFVSKLAYGQNGEMGIKIQLDVCSPDTVQHGMLWQKAESVELLGMGAAYKQFEVLHL